MFCLVSSQRPWHAGSSNRLPMVLPQYIDERIAAEQAAQTNGQPGVNNQSVLDVQPSQTVQPGEAQAQQGVAQGPTAVGDTGVLNRIDGSTEYNVAQPTAVLGTSDTINPADLPVDAHGDINLINRIKTWPRDKQPFWYINWQAIQAHRGDVNHPAQVAQVQPNTQSFFAG